MVSKRIVFETAYNAGRDEAREYTGLSSGNLSYSLSSSSIATKGPCQVWYHTAPV